MPRLDPVTARTVNRVFHDDECAYYDDRFALRHGRADARRALGSVDSLLGRRLRIGERILDVGCGPAGSRPASAASAPTCASSASTCPPACSAGCSSRPVPWCSPASPPRRSNGAVAGYHQVRARTGDVLARLVLTASYVMHGRRPALDRVAGAVDRALLERVVGAHARHVVVAVLQPSRSTAPAVWFPPGDVAERAPNQDRRGAISAKPRRVSVDIAPNEDR